MCKFRCLHSGDNFYPRPPRGGRLALVVQTAWRYLISIHALREEGDVLSPEFHTSRVLFLSTPSARRATYNPAFGQAGRPISIHALRGEGDGWASCTCLHQVHFYPRPPRGGRLFNLYRHPVRVVFLSTPSAGRATLGRHETGLQQGFLSTPSAGRATIVLSADSAPSSYFYPRPP